jgi:glycine cleavage system aminomethyltransferase T
MQFLEANVPNIGPLLSGTSNKMVLIPSGGIVHTGMQNELGGYENDCSVARLAENHFMLISPSIQQMRSYAWMKHRLPKDGSVYLQVQPYLGSRKRKTAVINTEDGYL